MSTWKRSGAGFLGAVLLAAGGCASDSNRAEPRRAEPRPVGKVRAAVDVRSSVEGEVDSGEGLSVTLTITPQAACGSLQTRVRGLDGVEVSGGDDAAQNHGPCVAGVAVTHVARVRVPEGVAGFLVVNVNLVRIDGRRVTDAHSFELHRPGATPRAQRSGEPVRTDAEGRPIQVMPAESP